MTQFFDASWYLRKQTKKNWSVNLQRDGVSEQFSILLWLLLKHIFQWLHKYHELPSAHLRTQLKIQCIFIWLGLKLKLRQNGRHFVDEIFNSIFLYKILYYVPKCQINNKSALVQIIVWHRQTTSYCLNQWWPSLLMYIASFNLNELLLNIRPLHFIGEK